MKPRRVPIDYDQRFLVEWHDELSRIFREGTGSPEGVVAAPVGTLYRRLDGGAGSTLYVKESGTGNTGWSAK